MLKEGLRTIPARGAALAFESWRKQGYALNEHGDIAEYIGDKQVRLSIKVDGGHRRVVLTIPDEVPGFIIKEVP